MENGNIKVSIIVPVYNCEKFIKRCMNSLANQTLRDIEIIIINDGSSDKSEDIIKTFSDDRIKYYKQSNSGQSVARNFGIDVACGEYIGFVDGDDWVDDNFFENLYEAAIKNEADIAVAGIIRLHRTNKKYYLKFSNSTITTDTNEKFRLCDVPEKSYVWNKIYKADKLKNSNIRFEPNRIFEDVVFTPEILLKSEKLVTVPDTYYYYWRNSGSTVTKRDKKANEDSIYMHKKAEEFFIENNIDVSVQKPETKRYKFLGLSIFKVKTKGDTKEYRLFNIIKWVVKKQP